MYDLASHHTDLDIAESSGAEYARNVMPPWAHIAAASGIVIRTSANQVISVEQCTYVPHNASLRFRREPLTPGSTLPGIRCAMTRSKCAVTVQVQPQRRRVGVYVNAGYCKIWQY